MQALGLVPTTALWVYIAAWTIIGLLCVIFVGVTKKDWPYFPDKYDDAAHYVFSTIFKTVGGWVLSAPFLVARLIVAIAILRWLGWLQ